jgi:hypothetical protein
MTKNIRAYPCIKCIKNSTQQKGVKEKNHDQATRITTTSKTTATTTTITRTTKYSISSHTNVSNSSAIHYNALTEPPNDRSKYSHSYFSNLPASPKLVHRFIVRSPRVSLCRSPKIRIPHHGRLDLCKEIRRLLLDNDGYVHGHLLSLERLLVHITCLSRASSDYVPFNRAWLHLLHARCLLL